jgi:hypothetical protein
LNGITNVPNFMKIYHALQKLLVWDRQTGELKLRIFWDVLPCDHRPDDGGSTYF